MARPAFFVVILSQIIFQVPLAFFSPIFERSLANYIQLSVSVHAIIIISLAWVAYTPGLTQQIFPSRAPQSPLLRMISKRSYLLLMALIATLTGVYLWRVSWECTGLYAMMVDPELTLLARETSIKLVGTSLATYGYGMLANVLCPIMAYVCVIKLQADWLQRRFLLIPLWLGVGLLSMIIVMLPGIKGNMIPTIMFMSLGALIACKQWISRILAVILVFGLSLSFFSAFEVLREREGFAGKQYQFGKCAQRLEACTEAQTLLDSMKARDLSLGVNRIRLAGLNQGLKSACNPLKIIYAYPSETRFIYRLGGAKKSSQWYPDESRFVRLWLLGPGTEKERLTAVSEKGKRQ